MRRWTCCWERPVQLKNMSDSSNVFLNPKPDTTMGLDRPRINKNLTKCPCDGPGALTDWCQELDARVSEVVSEGLHH